MTLIPKTLFGRNALLIFGLIGLAQFAGFVVFRELVQKPRTALLADMAADYVAGVVDGVEALPPSQRQLFLHSFANARKIEIIPVRERGPELMRMPNPLWQQYARIVAGQLHKEPSDVVWSNEHEGSLWIRVPIAQEDYWLIMRGLTAGAGVSGLALSISLVIAALAIVGAFLIQRRVNRPLRALVKSAREMAQGRYPSPLPEEMPVEIATLTRAFNRMTTSLRSIDQERSLMLAGVSHDLRTPLSKVRLAIEIMERQIEPDLLSSIRQSLRQVDVIIDQFMNYERANTSEPEQQLDVSEVIRECVRNRPSNEAPFEMSLSPLPALLVQRQSLSRAICNLMDNATRYGAAPFEVRSHVDREAVHLTILDRGHGVPATQIDEMKQPFRRGNAARNGVAGSGLGLAIVERIAAQHDGRLILGNRVGGGFEAKIELPLIRRAARLG